MPRDFCQSLRPRFGGLNHQTLGSPAPRLYGRGLGGHIADSLRILEFACQHDISSPRVASVATVVNAVHYHLYDPARFSAVAFTWHGFLTRVWGSRGSSDGWYVGKPTCRIGHFLPNNQNVVRTSKLGFPTSDPALLVIPLDHGLSSTLRLRPEGKSHVTKSAESRRVI